MYQLTAAAGGGGEVGRVRGRARKGHRTNWSGLAQKNRQGNRKQKRLRLNDQRSLNVPILLNVLCKI